MIEEKITVLYDNSDLRVERIQSFGAASPEGFLYDQEQGELVMLETGAAILSSGGRSYKLKAGSRYFIPPHEKHRVEETTYDCVWLCVFVPSSR